jgi:four helix bundle protein
LEVKKRSRTQKYDIEERLIDFAIDVIDILEKLPNSRVGNHIANQLVRSGTAPAANYGEAQSAESRNDFIHKVRLSLKELRETGVWLVIIQRKSLIKQANMVSKVLRENCELIAILAASIRTAKERK